MVWLVATPHTVLSFQRFGIIVYIFYNPTSHHWAPGCGYHSINSRRDSAHHVFWGEGDAMSWINTAIHQLPNLTAPEALMSCLY